VALAIAAPLADRDTDRICDRYCQRSLFDPKRWNRKGVSQVVDVCKKIIDACPYCGAMEISMHSGIRLFRVACPSCSATGPLHKDISTAISLWNTVSRSWFNQSLTTHIPPAMEVSQETCDQLRRENDLLEEMISDRLGSQGELERGEDPGELERGEDPGERTK
jgi:hypothetical protein